LPRAQAEIHGEVQYIKCKRSESNPKLKVISRKLNALLTGKEEAQAQTTSQWSVSQVSLEMDNIGT